MASGLKRTIIIKYKRFRKWTKSDRFAEFIAKLVALFIIGLMVLSIFVVMLNN